MDDAGWRARHRARKEREEAPLRGPDGHFIPREQVGPMQEDFIGGFHPGSMGGQPPPPPPPKDHHFRDHLPRIPLPIPSVFGGDSASTEYDGMPPPAPWLPTYPSTPKQTTVSPVELSHMGAVERTQALKVARMTPHLQFMCGPLLRYDTVDANKFWRGFVLIVTADAGSIYEPHPLLTYEYDPDKDAASQHTVASPYPFVPPNGQSFDLGPHPADPSSTILPTSIGSNLYSTSPVSNSPYASNPRVQMQHVRGEEIWVYPGNNGTFTFWRFAIAIPLGPHEMKVKYSINSGQQLEFYVPGRNQNMRWAAHSCNGFSAGVDQDSFRGQGFKTGYDPVWMDLLHKHSEQPFHALVGGGDQLYCDGITREPELQEWVTTLHPAKKRDMPCTPEIQLAIDRFYFNHYCQHFRSGAFARANCSIPMLNMLDDHDLIDGFGSYPDDLQSSPIFNRIGSRGYFFFLLFQCFINPERDGTDDQRHVYQSLVIGGPGSFVPFPSHSFLTYLGPQQWMLLLDCRAERKKNQVCSPSQYNRVMARLGAVPAGVEHLSILLGIPIAYPRLVFLETALESKFNPLVAIGKSGSSALGSFINKFNADAELLDDLNDHWTAKGHKKERNWFIEQVQSFARQRRIRCTFVSGDVHCAAVGLLKTLAGGKGKQKIEIPPEQDYRYMLNVVTSAIVNTPPPAAVLTMVGALASKTHKTMHYCDTDETMIPLFDRDTNGSNNKNKFIMGRRNWTAVNWDYRTGDLEFDIRIEIEKGHGQTKGYAVRAPAPRWDSLSRASFSG